MSESHTTPARPATEYPVETEASKAKQSTTAHPTKDVTPSREVPIPGSATPKQ